MAREFLSCPMCSCKLNTTNQIDRTEAQEGGTCKVFYPKTCLGCGHKWVLERTVDTALADIQNIPIRRTTVLPI